MPTGQNGCLGSIEAGQVAIEAFLGCVDSTYIIFVLQQNDRSFISMTRARRVSRDSPARSASWGLP